MRKLSNAKKNRAGRSTWNTKGQWLEQRKLPTKYDCQFQGIKHFSSVQNGNQRSIHTEGDLHVLYMSVTMICHMMLLIL